MISDHLNIERALSGTMAVDTLGPEEKEFCVKYRPVFEIGRMAGHMARGYYAYRAAITVARDPRANSLVTTEAGSNQTNPVGHVTRKDGTGHVYDILSYLDNARTNPEVLRDLERIWIVGSLIAIGDALDKRKYLNHLPLFELVRHLRTGVAHGNAFDIRYPDTLRKYPAHNRQAPIKNAVFEIKPDLDGRPVLFEFMGAADVLDLLMSIESYLTYIRRLVKLGELDSLLQAIA
jgi:hypothetical protein